MSVCGVETESEDRERNSSRFHAECKAKAECGLDLTFLVANYTCHD